jgi:hypothetical protein
MPKRRRQDALVEFYEQHRYIDLDGDGYPEPYVVTTTKDGRSPGWSRASAWTT